MSRHGGELHNRSGVYLGGATGGGWVRISLGAEGVNNYLFCLLCGQSRKKLHVLCLLDVATGFFSEFTIQGFFYALVGGWQEEWRLRKSIMLYFVGKFYKKLEAVHDVFMVFKIL